MDITAIVSADYSVTDDGDMNGVVTVTFSASESTKTVTVTVMSDSNLEGAEDILVFLTNPVGNNGFGAAPVLGDLTTGVLTIYDADLIGTCISILKINMTSLGTLKF